MDNIEELKRRLARLESMRDKLLTIHKGKELNYIYWVGYELGYIKGKISVLEEIIDYLEC